MTRIRYPNRTNPIRPLIGIGMRQKINKRNKFQRRVTKIVNKVLPSFEAEIQETFKTRKLSSVDGGDETAKSSSRSMSVVDTNRGYQFVQVNHDHLNGRASHEHQNIQASHEHLIGQASHEHLISQQGRHCHHGQHHHTHCQRNNQQPRVDNDKDSMEFIRSPRLTKQQEREREQKEQEYLRKLRIGALCTQPLPIVSHPILNKIRSERELFYERIKGINSHIKLEIKTRKEDTPVVYDRGPGKQPCICFSGKNYVWSGVADLSGRNTQDGIYWPDGQ